MEHNNSQVFAVRSQWIMADAESLSKRGKKAMREGTNYKSNQCWGKEERHGDGWLVVDC